MIYFKCSQCGENMEAPASLRGQLLPCPKCGSHQIVRDVCWRRILFVIISLLILIGIYKIGLEVGHKRGEEDGTLKEHRKMQFYTNVGYQEGNDVGYQEGYDAALEDYNNYSKTIEDWLGVRKIDQGIACNIDQAHMEQGYADLMKISKENNLSPATVIAMFRTYAQTQIDWDKWDRTFKKEHAEEPNTEPNTTEQANFKRMKNHIENDIANGLVPTTYGPPASKNKGYRPDYSDVDKWTDELYLKEAKKLNLTLEEYKALQRLWQSAEHQTRIGAKPIKLTPDSREFSPERLAQNSLYRSLFDGNKRRGPDAYLTPKEIQGRQKLLAKYKKLAHLQLKKERLEKLGQEDEVERINRLIEKTSQNK